MRQRPRKECRLCRNTALLCDSHLMPAAVYRTLRSKKAKNPNPMTFGAGFAYQSSDQFKDYLLCEECEARIRVGGEDWVLANSLRAGAFPLLDTLRTAQPEWNDRDIRIYSFARIPEIDCSALIYFAASVFWRAAAHTWRTKRQSVHIDLGPYEEPFRSFLLDQTQFPQTAALALVVLERAGEYAINPLSRNDDGYHEHQFTIPGMAFTLYVGGRLREELVLMNLAPAPQRYAFVYPRAEDMQIARLAGIYLQQRDRQMRERR